MADQAITRIAIFRNNLAVAEKTGNSLEIDCVWRDDQPLDEKMVWDHVRVHRDDDELARSSPFWIFKTREDLDGAAKHARELAEIHRNDGPTPENRTAPNPNQERSG